MAKIEDGEPFPRDGAPDLPIRWSRVVLVVALAMIAVAVAWMWVWDHISSAQSGRGSS